METYPLWQSDLQKELHQQKLPEKGQQQTKPGAVAGFPGGWIWEIHKKAVGDKGCYILGHSSQNDRLQPGLSGLQIQGGSSRQ